MILHRLCLPRPSSRNYLSRRDIRYIHYKENIRSCCFLLPTEGRSSSAQGPGRGTTLIYRPNSIISCIFPSKTQNKLRKTTTEVRCEITSSMAEPVARDQYSSSPATRIHTSPALYERPSEWYHPQGSRVPGGVRETMTRPGKMVTPTRSSLSRPERLKEQSRLALVRNEEQGGGPKASSVVRRRR